MSFIHDVAGLIFGVDVSEARIAANAILVLLGASINFAMDLGGRDQSSTRTPQDFSFKFLLLDNRKRLLISALFCIVVVIGGPGLVGMLELNWQINPMGSSLITILLGMGSDYLPMRIKQKYFNQETGK